MGYDEARVREVAGHPCVDQATLQQACPHGVFVARLARHRQLDLAHDWQAGAAAVRAQPHLPTMTQVFLGAKVRLSDALPWVVTVSGLVLFGAETTGWGRTSDTSIEFDLRPPGDWYALLEHRWFAFGRGRHWFFWDPWRLQQ